MTVSLSCAVSSPTAEPVIATGPASAEERPSYFTIDPAAPPLTAKTTAAVVITSLVADGPAQRAGVRTGDRLLAIDGCRLHDLAELRLWTETRAAGTTTERWTVARDGALISLTLDELDIAANVGVSGVVPSGQPGFDQLLERCGIAVLEADRPLLGTLPTMLRHAVQEWIDAQTEPPRAPDWLMALARVHLTALRGEGRIPPVFAAPLPLVVRYDAFLRAVIAQRQGGDRDPDLVALGADRFTAAVWWPYPAWENDPATPPYTRIYRYCQEHSTELSRLCSNVGYDLHDGQASIFRSRCDLVAAALAPDAAPMDLSFGERGSITYQLNDMAWALATDERIADHDLALAAGEELLRLGGRHLPAFMKDTVAACFARGGDFARAVRWQRIAVSEELGTGGNASDVSPHLVLYRAGKVCTEQRARLIPASIPYQDGHLKLEGFTDGGQRAGHWRAHREDGSVSIDGWMLDGRPCGCWQTFDGEGRKQTAGWVWQGKRIGTWRTFQTDGSTSSLGCFGLNEQETSQRVGRWTWFWTTGQPLATGCFVNGKREGPWRIWATDGRLLAETHFDKGEIVDGPWLTSPVIEELPPPLLEQPVTGADDF